MTSTSWTVEIRNNSHERAELKTWRNCLELHWRSPKVYVLSTSTTPDSTYALEVCWMKELIWKQQTHFEIRKLEVESARRIRMPLFLLNTSTLITIDPLEPTNRIKQNIPPNITISPNEKTLSNYDKKENISHAILEQRQRKLIINILPRLTYVTQCRCTHRAPKTASLVKPKPTPAWRRTSNPLITWSSIDGRSFLYPDQISLIRFDFDLGARLVLVVAAKALKYLILSKRMVMVSKEKERLLSWKASGSTCICGESNALCNITQEFVRRKGKEEDNQLMLTKYEIKFNHLPLAPPCPPITSKLGAKFKSPEEPQPNICTKVSNLSSGRRTPSGPDNPWQQPHHIFGRPWLFRRLLLSARTPYASRLLNPRRMAWRRGASINEWFATQRNTSESIPIPEEWRY